MQTQDIQDAFGSLLAHAAYEANRIFDSVSGLVSKIPDEYRVAAESRDDACLILLRDPPPTLQNALSLTPEGQGLLDRNRPTAPPAMGVRYAAEMAEDFTETQMTCLAAVVTDALRHWQTFRELSGETQASMEDAAALQDAPDGAVLLITRGETAYTELVGLTCLLGGASPAMASAQATHIARVLISQQMAKPKSGNASTAMKQALAVYEQYRRRRLVTISLHAVESDLEECAEEFDAYIRESADAILASSDSSKYRLLWRACLGALIEWYRVTGDGLEPRPISQAPSPDPTVRHATRVIAMVHELHKAGYQRVRMLPYLSPSGAHWRCEITFSDNVEDDGYTIKGFGSDIGCIARYSSSQENRYFDWEGAEKMRARELAARFLVAFPEIAKRGIGRDWLYAGWVTEVLGRAEQGQAKDLLILFADWAIDPKDIDGWLPPPPLRDGIPAG